MTGWDGFGKYVGIQGVLAVTMTAAAIGLMYLGKPVPSEAWGLLGVAWGVFFAKNGKAVAQSVTGSGKTASGE